MPVFDFRCEACQQGFTELISNSEQIFCPKCGSKKIKKLFGSFYTVSDSTRYEYGAKDLPSMEKLRQQKYLSGKLPVGKRDPLQALKDTPKLLGKKIKPRAAVKRRKK